MEHKLALDRHLGKTLVDQLYEKIQRAIAAGRYKENDVLPSICDMAALAGVSEKVSRGAYRKLAEKGWVETRPHVGSVVSSRYFESITRGRILMFNSAMRYTYASECFLSALRSKMITKGYRITPISAVSISAKYKFVELEALLREKWDLVLEFGEEPRSRSLIENAGWPFVIIGNGGGSSRSLADNCRGVIRILSSRALPSFVRQCARKNVHRVVQFLYGSGAFNAADMLNALGVRVETVRVPWKGDLTVIENAAYWSTLKFLCSGKLPDVFLYTDDYLARGGLMALAMSNVRIPEDVGVVTLVNKGFLPFWPTRLTCLSVDFDSYGRDVARKLCDLLNGRENYLNVDFGSEWCEGETF